MQMPTKDQWGDWKNHPCTLKMLEILKEYREDGIEELCYGSNDNDLIHYGTKVGKVNALTGLINLSFIPQEDKND